VATECNTDISEERIHRYFGTVRYTAVVFSYVLTTLHTKKFTPCPDHTKYHLGSFCPENPYLWLFHSVQFYVLLYIGHNIMGMYFCFLQQLKVWAVLLFIAYQYDL